MLLRGFDGDAAVLISPATLRFRYVFVTPLSRVDAMPATAMLPM